MKKNSLTTASLNFVLSSVTALAAQCADEQIVLLSGLNVLIKIVRHKNHSHGDRELGFVRIVPRSLSENKVKAVKRILESVSKGDLDELVVAYSPHACLHIKMVGEDTEHKVRIGRKRAAGGETQDDWETDPPPSRKLVIH